MLTGSDICYSANLGRLDSVAETISFVPFMSSLFYTLVKMVVVVPEEYRDTRGSFDDMSRKVQLPSIHLSSCASP